MSKILKNQTASAVYLADTGATVPASGQYVIPLEDYQTFAVSDDVVTNIGDSTLVVNDGIKDLNIANGVSLIQGGYPSEIDANIVSASSGTTGDFFHDIAMGNVAGHTIVTKYGRNDSVPNNTTEDVTIYGDQYWPTSAAVITVSSSHAQDKSNGSGARTVMVSGLDANWAEQDEVVTMNGTTDVTTTNTFIRVHKMFVVTGGADAGNLGTITAEQGNNNTIAQIAVGKNSTEQLVYTIPAGKMGMVYTLRASVYSASGTGAKEGHIEFWVKPFGGVWMQSASEGVTSDGGSANFQPQMPLGVPAKSDVKITVSAASNNTAATAILQILLMEM